MKLFDLILKLIETLGLVESNEQQQLYTDVKAYEKTCTIESKEPIKRLYAKLHNGVLVRLLMPFFFYIALNKMKRVMRPELDGQFLDD